MTSTASVEQLTQDITRSFKAFAALRSLSPALHPGIEPAWIPLLFKLDSGPVRVGELAERIHSDISTVSRQVTPLVSNGLVEKTPDPDDGRAQLLTLTAHGREVADALREQRCALISLMVADWPDDKLVGVAQAMADFADAMEDALRSPELRQRLPRPVTL